jgi:tRNA dimethylallyltransferase
METRKNKPKLLVIVGPTASGKTALAIALAKKFNGELIAADSRTVYKGMDIGTGKDKSYPHKLIDVVRPDQTLNLDDYKAKAVRAIRAAVKKGKLPILVGGTGLYVWAVVDNLLIPKVPPQSQMRAELEKKSVAELHKLLVSIDPDAAAVTGENKRRIIRALEVVSVTGEKFSQATRKGEPLFDCLQIGLLVPREELVERINKRVEAMMKDGFMNEVMALRKKLYAPGLPSMSGIGYAELNAVIDGVQTLSEAIERTKARTRQYARRQMTWFRRDSRIQWVADSKTAISLVDKFVSKKH